MSSYADVFRELRQQIADLKELQGECSTTKIMRQVDPLFRTLIKVKLVLGKQLINQRQIRNLKDMPNDEFFALFCRVYSPDSVRDRRILCKECFCEIDPYLGDCPYCLTPVDKEENQKNLRLSAMIDFSIINNGPDWKVDTDANDILKLKEEMKTIPELKPCTKVDLINGPKPSSEKTRTRKVTQGKTAAHELRVWIRKKELLEMRPFTPQSLKKLIHQDIRTLITVMPNYDHSVMNNWNVVEMSRYILGHQDQEIDLGERPRITQLRRENQDDC